MLFYNGYEITKCVILTDARMTRKMSLVTPKCSKRSVGIEMFIISAVIVYKVFLFFIITNDKHTPFNPLSREELEK